MLTDEHITTLLRRGFAQAAADLELQPAPVHVVRRRHRSARRRRRVLATAAPTAALAAGIGFALVGQGTPSPHQTRSNAPVAVPRHSTPPKTHASTPMRPASYKLVRNTHNAVPSCPAGATSPVGKSDNPSGAWYWTDGHCVFVGLNWAATKPADATPVEIEGYPGLYGTLENGVRTIYAPSANVGWSGGWVALSMPAGASQEQVVHIFLVPAG